MTDHASQLPTTPSLRGWFEAALRQPPAEQLAWLESRCSDPTLRDAVRELLIAHASDDEPYGEPIGEWFLAIDDDEPLPQDSGPQGMVGRKIADYRLLRPLGVGGMATVFLAEREHADYDQRVAIKILRHGVLLASEMRMFRRERQMLAALDHPNVARLIDGGVTERGVPYLVLEYVDGMPITDHCRQNGTPLRARVELVCAVCRAVEHAHRALIVHRDIKPANVLVNRDGVVKLLDFGVAKLLHSDSRAVQTVDAFMTPDYAAPEQVARGGDSPALDVYALGVLLHELILGQRPPRGARVRPSQLAASTTERVSPEPEPATDPSTLRRFLSGDLDNSLERALQPEPLLRYRNAGELADDLQRFLDGEPVLAHPPSAWYRTKKFILRHRGAAALTAVLVVAMLASLMVAAWQGVEARRHAQRAEVAMLRAQENADRANAVVKYVLGVFNAAQELSPERDRLSPAQLTDVAQAALERNTTMPPLTRARMWDALARISDSLSQLDRARERFQKALAVLEPLAGADATQARAEIGIAFAQTLLHADLPSDALATINARAAPAGLADAALRFAAQQTLAEISYGLGQRDDALFHARAAAVEGAKAFAQGSEERLFAELLPARTQALLGQYAEALPLLENGLARWRALELPRDINYVNLETAVAVGRFQTGNPDAGLKLLDEAIVDVRAIHGAPSVTEVRMLENAAGMRFGRGETLPAIEQVNRAIAAAHDIFAPGSRELISLELTAAIFAAKTAPEDATRRFDAVAALCAAHADAAKLGDCGRVHASYASLLTRLDRLDDAARELELADAHQRRLFGPASLEVGSVAVARGSLELRRGRAAEALAAYDVALANYDAGKLDDQRRGRLLLGRAQAQLQLEQTAAAHASIQAAVANLDRYLTKDNRARADAQAWLAVVASADGAAEEAQKAARAALALDTEVAARLPEAVRESFVELAP